MFHEFEHNFQRSVTKDSFIALLKKEDNFNPTQLMH